MFGSIVGNVLGPVLGYQGQRETNQANREMQDSTNALSLQDAQRNREFQQASADKQMSFQSAQNSRANEFAERMASTAHQRQVADLKAAGLNPILSAMGSGAASPSGQSAGGASASGSSASLGTSKDENALAHLVGVKRAILDAKQTAAQTKLLGDQSLLSQAQKRKTDIEAKVATKSIPEAEMKNMLFDAIKKGGNNILNYLKAPSPKENSKPWLDHYNIKLKKPKGSKYMPEDSRMNILP